MLSNNIFQQCNNISKHFKNILNVTKFISFVLENEMINVPNTLLRKGIKAIVLTYLIFPKTYYQYNTER